MVEVAIWGVGVVIQRWESQYGSGCCDVGMVAVIWGWEPRVWDSVS